VKTKPDGSSKASSRHHVLASIHFASPVLDVHGVKRSCLYADEAQWSIKPHPLQLSGPPPTSVVVLASQSGPSQVLPVPVWEVVQLHPATGRAQVMTLPLACAWVSNPMRVVREPSAADGAAQVRLVGVQEYEELARLSSAKLDS